MGGWKERKKQGMVRIWGCQEEKKEEEGGTGQSFEALTVELGHSFAT